MTWTPGPWEVKPHADGAMDELYGAFIWAGPALLPVELYGPHPNAEADARLIALAPELAASLEAVLGWLEGTDEIVTNHGAHSDAVWARKLLARAKGEA